jgi:O6-methylguanine-DNA--protein-cysteine methyltransferase
MELHLNRIPSPLGEMLLVTDGQGAARALDFTNHVIRPTRELRERYGDMVLRESGRSEEAQRVADKLGAYFKGNLTALDDIPLAIDGSEFQRKVWAALRGIHAGTTTIYGKLARSLGFSDPRMQTPPMVVPLERGDATVFAVSHRPVKGSRGIYRVNLRHAVSRVRSGSRTAINFVFHYGP